MPRRRVPGITALVVALALQLLPVGDAAAADTRPTSMAATGDSITRAFNTCFLPLTDCLQNSWSTGTSKTVNSHANRLGITSSAFNDAVSGAKMADLKSQMSNVVTHGKVIDYVTVMMGGNDVCTSSVQDMTTPTTFEQQLRDGLNVLASSQYGRDATLYAVSIPNVYRLWEILHTNSTAVSRWKSYDICPALLANATSLDPADEARRRIVRARNLELNRILAVVCAEYAENRTKGVNPALDCRLDGYAGFRYDFVPNDVSTRDYFHPSTAGQKTIAQVSWDVGPYGTAIASTAPVAHFTMSCAGLSCSFNAGPSLDPDRGTLSYAWNFGDGTTASGVTTSHSYGAGGTYTVTLTVSDGSLADTDAGTFAPSGSATNNPPTANFSASCTGLTCDFKDSSIDSDGSVVAWSWNFDDGSGSTTQHPTHTYAAAGTYTVSLTVTDDDGASSAASQSVTVAAASGFTLSAVGYKLKGVQHADLSWSGADSTNVDAYRDGTLISTTTNDGAHTDPIGKKGGGSYVYKVCEETTQICSNEATVSF